MFAHGFSGVHVQSSSVDMCTQRFTWMASSKFCRHTPHTGWRKCTECLTLQVSFRKRAIIYRSLLRKITYKDEAIYESSQSCITLSFAKCNTNAPHVLDLQKRRFTRVRSAQETLHTNLIAKETLCTCLICKRDVSHEFDLQKRILTRIWSAEETRHTYLNCKRDTSHVFDLHGDDSHVLELQKRRISRISSSK